MYISLQSSNTLKYNQVGELNFSDFEKVHKGNIGIDSILCLYQKLNYVVIN